MINESLEYTHWREAIVSGEPEILLATPATPASILQMGLNIGNWDPACTRPMFLIIMKGDFDGRYLFVNPASSDQALPGQYLAYVFDLSHGPPGDIIFTILSDDGSAFKQALNDPELPDPDFAVSEPEPPFVPCDDVWVEGEPEPSPTTSP
jgi:hypothetical protein